MNRISCTAVFALLLGTADVAAQVPGVSPGTRVRVSAPDAGGRLTGGVAFMDADTLVLTMGERRAVVSTPSIERLDVSRGRHRSRGAWMGAGIGALAGGAVFAGLLVSQGEDSQFAGPGFVLGAMVGAPAGAIVGGIVGSERWERIYPPGVGQARSGVAMGVRIAVR